MKHYPLVLLYLMVSGLGLIGLRDSARQNRSVGALQQAVERSTHRANVQLRAATKSLRLGLDEQSQAYEADVAKLRHQLESNLAVSDSLQQEVKTLFYQLDAELAARGKELDLHTSRIACLSSKVEEAGSQVDLLSRQLEDTELGLAAALQKECDARQQLSTQYNNAFGKQSELLNILQQLADASQTRADAARQISEQAAAEAACLTRLARHAGQGDPELAAAAANDEVVHVAQVVDGKQEEPSAPADLEPSYENETE